MESIALVALGVFLLTAVAVFWEEIAMVARYLWRLFRGEADDSTRQ